jgi:hypothetical protein
MNNNTIAGIYNNPAFALNSTTETAILNAVGAPLVVGLAPQNRVSSIAVNIRGKATGGTAATLLIKLYRGNSATLASDSVVAAFTVSGAAIPVAGGNFDVTAQLSWDAVSQTVHGMFWGQTNGTLTAFGATTAQTGVVDPSGLQFVASATFGAALATNSVTVTEFTIDQV